VEPAGNSHILSDTGRDITPGKKARQASSYLLKDLVTRLVHAWFKDKEVLFLRSNRIKNSCRVDRVNKNTDRF
jgi:hypothetical protein